MFDGAWIRLFVPFSLFFFSPSCLSIKPEKNEQQGEYTGPSPGTVATWRNEVILEQRPMVESMAVIDRRASRLASKQTDRGVQVYRAFGMESRCWMGRTRPQTMILSLSLSLVFSFNDAQRCFAGPTVRKRSGGVQRRSRPVRREASGSSYRETVLLSISLSPSLARVPKDTSDLLLEDQMSERG